MKIKLKEIRKKRNLTQQQLAEMAGVSYQSISKYETGTRMPDLETMMRIANYFGVPIDSMILKEDAEEPYNQEKKTSIIESVLEFNDEDKEKIVDILEILTKEELDIIAKIFSEKQDKRKEIFQIVNIVLRR